MESSQFTDSQPSFESLEPLETQGATCDTFRVKLYGKLHFLKRLKPEFTNDIRYQEAFRKEFETGYRLEHSNLVRYISLTDDGILMEYIDGETLTQCLANHPDYFKKNNTDKFLRQLLDVVAYLHSHQVLHLDLKPDNILLTRINNDVKLIDLGCCYTDTFTDTQGRTNRYAAPEQLSGEPDVRTDIYAIGKILELLPHSNIYNKVIARCTAPDKTVRYQSVEEILNDINHQKRNYRYVAAFIAAIVALIICIALLPRQQEVAPIIQTLPNDSMAQMHKDAITLSEGEEMDSSRDLVLQNNESLITPKDNQTQYKEEMTHLIDKAYHSTIFTFCDSVFPSPIPSTGKAWADSSTEFHNQIIQIGDELTKKYPNISESNIREEAESRFQSLVSYVFNKMRANGEDHRNRSSE